MAFDDTRVVLVRPHHAGNLGAVARVMHNFGVRHLYLINPVADIADREARRLSAHGEFILDEARIAYDLHSAVADCAFVAATSANIAGIVRETSSIDLRSGARRFVQMSISGVAALVFGPEPSGLTNDEIMLCHALLHIPASPNYSALNLAQAVAICLYEVSMFNSRASIPAKSEEVVSHAALQRMFDHLRRGLEAIHFLYGPKADPLMQ